jgi:hypothetical protein
MCTRILQDTVHPCMSLHNVNELIVCRRKESQLETFEIYLQYVGGLPVIPRA